MNILWRIPKFSWTLLFCSLFWHFICPNGLSVSLVASGRTQIQRNKQYMSIFIHNQAKLRIKSLPSNLNICLLQKRSLIPKFLLSLLQICWCFSRIYFFPSNETKCNLFVLLYQVHGKTNSKPFWHLLAVQESSFF